MNCIWTPPGADAFDPRNWQDNPHEFRIYGDDRASIWAVVDEIDYHWAIRHCWCVKRNPFDKNYLRRAVGENANGQRLRTFTLYLHVEILKVAGVVPRSPEHKIADHRDGDSLNCRRSNLRWVTPSMNSRNRHGSHKRDLIEG